MRRPLIGLVLEDADRVSRRRRRRARASRGGPHASGIGLSAYLTIDDFANQDDPSPGRHFLGPPGPGVCLLLSL